MSPSRPMVTASSATESSRSSASRVSRVAVTRVVAVECRWSSQTPRASRAACSTPAARSGSHWHNASWTSGRTGGIRFRTPVGRGVPVHEPHRRPGQARGLRGHLPGLPGLQLPVLHQRPQPREPEAQLDRLDHQPQPRVVADPERRGQLLDRELRDPRRPDPTQRLPADHQVLVGDRVQVDPRHRQPQQPGLLPVRRPPGSGDRVEDRRGGVLAEVGDRVEGVDGGAGHASTLDPTTDSPDARIPLSTRGNSL